MVDDVVEFANQVLPEQGTGKGEEPRAARWMALGLAGCLALSLSGCGSSGGSDDDDEVIDDTLPAGKVRVDGHVFNPDFLDDGRDYYALVSYFNADGSLASYHEVYEWDGEKSTYSNDYVYHYDATDRLDSEDRESTYTREGLALYSRTRSTLDYSYNGIGEIASEVETITGFDNDGDDDFDDIDGSWFPGAVIARSLYSYNAADNLSVKQVDSDDSTPFDLTHNYAYDTLTGRLVTETIIDGNTGITATREYAYDMEGRIAQITDYPTLADYPGSPDVITSYFYDAADRIEREEIDSGVYNSSDPDPDGNADEIITYVFGSEGEPVEKSTEQLFLTSKRIDKIKYLHEVIDDDDDGTPESTVTYVFWLDTQNVPIGEDYQPDGLPDWVQNAQTRLNNGNADDGWGLNWEGHGSTCTTCGNMLGEVNRIIFGF